MRIASRHIALLPRNPDPDTCAPVWPASRTVCGRPLPTNGVSGTPRLGDGGIAAVLSPEGVVAVLLVAFAVLATGCLPDVEHSNPLDPNSDAYEEAGRVEGRTTRYYSPHPPLENVEVRLSPGPYVAESGADGRFSIEGVPVGSYTITADKEGFAPVTDSLTVSIGAAASDVRLRLNAMPVIEDLQIRTVHVSRWWPQEDLYQLEVIAEVGDPDGAGDVADVWLEIPSYGFARELAATGTVGRYALLLPADSLPGPTLHALQGAGFVIHVEDEVGVVAESEPKSIVRVIEDIPVAIEPQALSSVEDGRPNLIWEDAALPFEFTYRIDVVREEANVQAVVETITDIPSTSTSYRLETPLTSGTYFWTVSVVDSFGNRSRSKEAGFMVP